jgi:hypothetical protein
MSAVVCTQCGDRKHLDRWPCCVVCAIKKGKS